MSLYLFDLCARQKNDRHEALKRQGVTVFEKPADKMKFSQRWSRNTPKPIQELRHACGALRAAAVSLDKGEATHTDTPIPAKPS